MQWRTGIEMRDGGQQRSQKRKETQGGKEKLWKARAL